jgi:hypothetical protein
MVRGRVMTYRITLWHAPSRRANAEQLKIVPMKISVSKAGREHRRMAVNHSPFPRLDMRLLITNNSARRHIFLFGAVVFELGNGGATDFPGMFWHLTSEKRSWRLEQHFWLVFSHSPR